jgi:uncharacterized membrane protein
LVASGHRRSNANSPFHLRLARILLLRAQAFQPASFCFIKGEAPMAIEVRRAVTINRPRSEIYAFWRQLDNLPRFMTHLKSVANTGNRTSHWVAKGPAGSDVEWDAEIVQEVQDEYLAWRSLPDSEIPNRGEVRFKDAPAGRGTEVHAFFTYDPPAGAVGAAVAKIFGEDPDSQTREDLRRFKQILETGEVPTTEGQTSGRNLDGNPEPVEQHGQGQHEHEDDRLVAGGSGLTKGANQ